jgi:hypothetical protein
VEIDGDGDVKGWLGSKLKNSSLRRGRMHWIIVDDHYRPSLG